MTFKFSRLPLSVLVGYLAFGELIDGGTWVGAIIIFAATAFVTRQEAQLARRRSAAALGETTDPCAPTSLRPKD
jgi:drug/metabolite transporter (DMT)-like permease